VGKKRWAEELMAGLNREEYERAAKEIQEAWSRAASRDAGFKVIVDFGRKYGYKNVMAAIQGRTPKQFDREKTPEELFAEDDARAEQAGEA
jgi:hypothetical protein